MSAVMEAREPSAKYLSALQPPLVQHFELLATGPGGVAKLRELILTLAVQGKLVPQDPRDEPAGELLKQIRAERAFQIAEGKAKRGKPLAELTEEDRPFGIPRTWCWVRLGDVTNYGSPVKAGALLPDTWVLDMEDIEKSSGRLLQKLRLFDRPALSDKNRFTKGDVLYGKLRPYLNKVLVADEDGVCTTEIIPFRCYGEYEPGYFRLALSSPYFLEYVNARSYGMKMPRLGTDDARNAPLPLPPLAEQSRIVTRVEELMRLCDVLEAKGQLEAAQHAQLLQTLLGALTASTSPDELADNWQRVATHFDGLLDRTEAIDALEQTILQLAVRGLLVPQDPKDEPASELLKKIRAEKDRLITEGKIKRDKPLEPVAIEEVPFVLPTGWSWVRFDELIHPLKPIAYGVLVPGPDVEAGVPFVRIADLSIDNPAPMPEKSIGHDIDSQFQRTRLEGGEILMGVVGSIGKLGVAPPTWAGANIARAICRIVPADGGLREFVLFLLQTGFMQQSFVDDTRTLAQPTLNVGLIRQALTPVPPPAEQARIVARVGLLRRLCADLRQRLAARQTTQAHLAEALIDEVA